jgi:hypothetical protein
VILAVFSGKSTLRTKEGNTGIRIDNIEFDSRKSGKLRSFDFVVLTANQGSNKWDEGSQLVPTCKASKDLIDSFDVPSGAAISHLRALWHEDSPDSQIAKWETL